MLRMLLRKLKKLDNVNIGSTTTRTLQQNYGPSEMQLILVVFP